MPTKCETCSIDYRNPRTETVAEDYPCYHCSWNKIGSDIRYYTPTSDNYKPLEV